LSQESLREEQPALNAVKGSNLARQVLLPFYMEKDLRAAYASQRPGNQFRKIHAHPAHADLPAAG
jgi:hypothetical protein